MHKDSLPKYHSSIVIKLKKKLLTKSYNGVQLTISVS